MKTSILFFLPLMLASCTVGCGQNSPLNLTKPTTESTHRGEADAVNPARHVYVSCQDRNQSVTTNITNNCNKNNVIAAAPEGEGEAK